MRRLSSRPYKQILNRFIQKLLPICNDDTNQAQQELKWLKQHVMERTRSHSVMKPGNLSANEEKMLRQLVSDRVDHSKPLQYILGTQPFCNLDIVTRPPVLIPRWETEEWTMRVISLLYSRLHYLEKPIHVLDVCTGSGCIALSLAHNMPANTCLVRGIDISSQALILANLNLQVFRSNNLIKNDVTFSKVDIMNDDEIASFVQNNQPAFDLILSNPPYIPREQYDKLSDEVKLWEDEIALIADDNGTAFHSRIVNLAANGLLKRLKEHNVVPRLVMEFGADQQGATIIREMERSKFTSIEVWKDGVGRDRCVVGSISQ